jgi:UTP:GlnB (protein PII) uridylyltransferase
MDEAAKFLFVIRTHVHRLLERGDLRGTVGDIQQYIVDDTFVGSYKTEPKRRTEEYFRSQTEDSDPLSL